MVTKLATITIYKDIYSRQPYHVALHNVLQRIRTGHKSRELVQALRGGNTGAKKQLAAIVFSGQVEGAREDANLRHHSGMVILDFDHLGDRLPVVKKQMTGRPDVVAAFISPGGDGLKVVLRIADGAQHRQHYKALMYEIEGLDEKNINETRACFESYDPDIYINYQAVPYTKISVPVMGVVKAVAPSPAFKKLEQWLEKKGNIFASGNRNNYIFCLAGSACRFGIGEEEATEQIRHHYLAKDNDFTIREALSAIKSAYKRNAFGSAVFSNDILVERETLKEIEIPADDPHVRDVIYGHDVYQDALRLYHNGYESADPTGIQQIDNIFKWKRGELTVLTGIGNHGKSAMLNFLMLNKAAKDGSKWAVFSPENYPAHEFYHDLVETVLGADCTPNPHTTKPPLETYERAYDFVKKHFFYIYPKDLSPTPQYIKSRFLELIIKEKVDGCIIDPFNQLANDYANQNGRDDKYLETFLSDCSRFGIANNVYMVIVAHPHKLRKRDGHKNYDAPDVYDLAGGAMWNNKADNILVYHRPKRDEDPMSRECQLISKKIRRQKIVGALGTETFEYSRTTRRYLFDDFPLLHLAIAPLRRKRLFETPPVEDDDNNYNDT